MGIGFFTRQLRQAPVEEDGLTFSELLALSRLDRVGPATTSALARAEQITLRAMGATVTALEEHGLVERRPDWALTRTHLRYALGAPSSPASTRRATPARRSWAIPTRARVPRSAPR